MKIIAFLFVLVSLIEIISGMAAIFLIGRILFVGGM